MLPPKVPLNDSQGAVKVAVKQGWEYQSAVAEPQWHTPGCGLVMPAALVISADRDVTIRVIIETPDKIEGQAAYSTMIALGSAVAERCEVYIWPADQRPCDDSGKYGILHVKCAVADGTQLFLSSANLTEHAFTRNVELGVLLRG